jgi:hypothetical protein
LAVSSADRQYPKIFFSSRLGKKVGDWKLHGVHILRKPCRLLHFVQVGRSINKAGIRDLASRIPASIKDSLSSLLCLQRGDHHLADVLVLSTQAVAFLAVEPGQRENESEFQVSSLDIGFRFIPIMVPD